MPAADWIVGSLMMAAGAAIALVFGGGLVAFLVTDIGDVIRGTPNVGRLMTTLLVGPIVGGAPALLGLVLVRMGWRRIRPPSTALEESWDE